MSNRHSPLLLFPESISNRDLQKKLILNRLEDYIVSLTCGPVGKESLQSLICNKKGRKWSICVKRLEPYLPRLRHEDMLKLTDFFKSFCFIQVMQATEGCYRFRTLISLLLFSLTALSQNRVL